MADSSCLDEMAVPGKKANKELPTGCQDSGDIFCDPCHEIIVTFSKPDGFCPTCNEYLCKTCLKAHGLRKITRNHAVLFGEDMPGSRPPEPTEECTDVCEKHSGQIIRYYCKHHQHIGCMDCIALEHTSCGPHIALIANISSEESTDQEFQEFSDKLDRLSTLFTGSLTKSESNAQSAETNFKQAANDASKFNEEMVNKLSSLKNVVERCATEMRSKDCDKMQRLSNQTKSLLQETEQIKTEFKSLKMSGRRAQQFTMMKKMNSHLEELERLGIEIEDDNFISDYQFIPDKRIRDILTSTSQLGSLITKSNLDLVCPEESSLSQTQASQKGDYSPSLKVTQSDTNKDTRSSPECQQKSTKAINVLVKVQGESFGHECSVTLTDFLRYTFLEKEREYTGKISEMFKQEFNIELCFNRKNNLILTFGEASEQCGKIDLIVKRIFESMDGVQINKVPTHGLDPIVLDDRLVTEFDTQGVKFLSEYDKAMETLVCLYLEKDAKKVNKTLQLVIKHTYAECKKIVPQALIKEKESESEEKECTAEFCIVYKDLFDLAKVKEELKSHRINLEVADITVDEEKHLIHLRLGRNRKGNKEKDMQVLKKITEKYPANTVSFQDIKWSEKGSTTILCGFLKSFFSDMLEKITEGKSPVWYVNERASRVSVCTCSQPDTDDITNKLKSCLMYKKIDVDESQNFDTLNDVIAEIKINNHGQCICFVKDNKIYIWGLKDGATEAELKLKGELQAREESKGQQDESLGNGTHENGIPVSKTNENDDPKQGPPNKEMSQQSVGLSNKDAEDTNMKGNGATTESNAPGNNAPHDSSLQKDVNDIDPTESAKLNNDTPKTEYMCNVTFKPNSTNVFKLMMKQGALDDLKAKLNIDFEMNQFGVILKLPNMAQTEAIKGGLIKREESFEFEKKTISLPLLQKDELDKVISQSDSDLVDVVVFQDESDVTGTTQKQSYRGRRWFHRKGHEIILIEDKVEHHWDELIIETRVGNGKYDRPLECKDGRWKAMLNIPEAEDKKDLHNLTKIFSNLLRNVHGHREISMSLEPIGNIKNREYAKEMLHTVQVWLSNKRTPVSLWLCAPESYETYMKCLNLQSESFPSTEAITVETTTKRVSLTLIGSRGSDFQQAEEKIKKLVEETKVKMDQNSMMMTGGRQYCISRQQRKTRVFIQ